MQFDVCDLVDLLRDNSLSMLEDFQQQIGEDIILEYREAEQEYGVIASELRKMLPFETHEKVGDMEDYAGTMHDIHSLLCYLKGAQDARDFIMGQIKHE